MFGKEALAFVLIVAATGIPVSDAQIQNLGPNLNEQAGPVIVYRQNFNVAAQIGPEWSTTQTSSTPNIGCTYCGRFLGEFGPQTVTLTLSGVPADRAILIRFNLFILKTWDGDGQHGFGPDVWSLTTSGLGACVELRNGVLPSPLLSPRVCGNTMVSATFANTGPAPAGCHALIPTQGYPQGASTPGRGSVAKDTLGYPVCGDTVYELTFVVTHTGSTLTLNFNGGATQDAGDESWGLDNVLIVAA